MKSSKRLKIALFIFITVTVVFIGLILMLLPNPSEGTDATTEKTAISSDATITSQDTGTEFSKDEE